MRCRVCSSVVVETSGLCLSCLRQVFIFDISDYIRSVKTCFRRDLSCAKGVKECGWSALCHLQNGFSSSDLARAIQEHQKFEGYTDCIGSGRIKCKETCCFFQKVCGTPMHDVWTLNGSREAQELFLRSQRAHNQSQAA